MSHEPSTAERLADEILDETSLPLSDGEFRSVLNTKLNPQISSERAREAIFEVIKRDFKTRLEREDGRPTDEDLTRTLDHHVENLRYLGFFSLEEIPGWLIHEEYWYLTKIMPDDQKPSLPEYYSRFGYGPNMEDFAALLASSLQNPPQVLDQPPETLPSKTTELSTPPKREGRLKSRIILMSARFLVSFGALIVVSFFPHQPLGSPSVDTPVQGILEQDNAPISVLEKKPMALSSTKPTLDISQPPPLLQPAPLPRSLPPMPPQQMMKAPVDRLATVAPKGWWRIDNDELVQDTLDPATGILFGDPDWEDYDFTVEAKRIRGNEDLSVIFHAVGWANSYWAGFGTYGNRWYEVSSAEPIAPNKRRIVAPIAGSVKSNTWYTISVKVRGAQCEILLDGNRIFGFEDHRYMRGQVGFRTFRTVVRFRNIKVTDPDNRVLWEGAPTLP